VRLLVGAATPLERHACTRAQSPVIEDDRTDGPLFPKRKAAEVASSLAAVFVVSIFDIPWSDVAQDESDGTRRPSLKRS